MKQPDQPLAADFYARLMQHHQQGKRYPPSADTLAFASRLLCTLFPENQGQCLECVSEIEAEIKCLQAELRRILEPLKEELPHSPEETALQFINQLPNIFQMLVDDSEAMLAGDPAASSLYEVIRAYPGFYAVAFYRFAHHLQALGVPLLPRLITEHAHNRTGIDIHPAASIGPKFCIDHGTGVVIGATSNIGCNVKVYQGVTLGALSVAKELASHKRHPTIEDNVVIYSGATILGGQTVIGSGSIIGGNVWLTESVSANSRVYYDGKYLVRPQNT